MFEGLGENLTYKSGIQMDGVFPACHALYGKHPLFNGKELCVRHEKKVLNANCSNIAEEARKYNDIDKNYNKDELVYMWKEFWMEYVNSFDILSRSHPKSIVTSYIARHAVELGFKYLLLKENDEYERTHKLGELAKKFVSNSKGDTSYMENVVEFCEGYDKYIEGDCSEFLRYPEYKDGYFGGNDLDLEWLSFNLAIIILQQIKYDNDSL